MYNINIMNKKEKSKVRYFLSLVPTTIVVLVTSLSEEDKQVLAYLISRTSNINDINNNDNKAARRHQHGSRERHSFECDCFECYASFWTRWDASEKRRVIHDIVEAYEDHLDEKMTKINGKSGNKKSDKRKNNLKRVCDEKIEDLVCFKGIEEGLSDNTNRVEIENKSSFRRFLSYFGDSFCQLSLI